MRILLGVLLCFTFLRPAQALPTVVTGKINPKARLFFWGYGIQKVNHFHRGYADSTGFFTVTIDISTVQLGNFFQVPIYLFPGDTITVSYGRVHTFHSKLYGDGLNFLPALENKWGLQTAQHTYNYPNASYFDQYRQVIAAATANRYRFLDSFHRAQPLDPQLLQMYRHDIQGRELLDLYAGLSHPRLNLDSVPAAILQEADNRSVFLQQDTLLYAHLYRRCANAYTSYQLKKRKMPYRESDIARRFEVSRELFAGKTREYVWTIQLAQYTGAFPEAYHPCYDRFIQSATDTLYRNYIIRHYAAANRQRDLLREDQLSRSPLSGADGETVSLQQLLERWKGKAVYIDFWASWCVPCVQEMPASHALAAEWKEKDLVFVYISLDTDRSKWRKGMEQYRVLQNSYLLPEAFSSLLAKELGIEDIPRYMILNKRGDLVEADAPRPGDRRLKVLLAKYAGE